MRHSAGDKHPKRSLGDTDLGRAIAVQQDISLYQVVHELRGRIDAGHQAVIAGGLPVLFAAQRSLVVRSGKHRDLILTIPI